MAFGEDSWLLFRTFVLFMQSDAIADILRFIACQLNPIQSALECASLVQQVQQTGQNIEQLLLAESALADFLHLNNLAQSEVVVVTVGVHYG